MNFEISYSAQQGGTAHHYRLTEGQLIYWYGDREWEFRLDLRTKEYAVKRKRQFHRFWYAGWIGVGMPLFTFAVIYLKEGVIDIGGAGWFHLGFLAVGVLLLFFYRRPTRFYEIRIGRGDWIRIFADPAQPGAAERLVEAIEIQNGTEP